MGLRRLPCGGSVTIGDDGEICRILRIVAAGNKFATFVLSHPKPLNEERKDPEQELCVRFARERGFDAACLLYLLPYRVAKVTELEKRPVPWGPGPFNKRVQDIEVMRAVNPLSGSRVIAAWGTAGRFKGAAGYFTRRHDGSPSCLSWLRSKPAPIFVLGFTPGGDPAPIDVNNLHAELKPLFGPRDDAPAGKVAA